MKNPYRKILMTLAFLFSITIYGQQDYSGKIQHYLEKNQTTYGLNIQDFSDLVIYDQYYTKSMEVEHVYVVQETNNIPVFNGIGNFAFKNGEIVHFANSFQTNLKNRANTSTPTLTPVQAVSQAVSQLGLDITGNIEILSAIDAQEFILSKAGVSQTEIPVKLVYQPISEESLRLAWDLSIYTLDGDHWWSVRVDAVTGEIINKGDWVVSCTFPEYSHNMERHATKMASTTENFGRASVSFLNDGSQYNVFPLPVESPAHGDRSIVSEPANATASPYGWHDTNEQTGAEFTITRGNNVFASEDRDGNHNPGYAPEGTSSLNFDFPLDLNQNPSGYIDAAVTNLFYMNNMMHDIWYLYGFDEVAGNFQQTNYTTFAQANDYVIALAQHEADLGPGNNASFATPSDGGNGVMRMYTWSAGGAAQVLTIHSPTELAGNYTGTAAGFGPPIPDAGITADFALVEDDNSGGSTDPNDACDAITNGAELSGKIAVLRRGGCSFDQKVLNAQNEGAIAVIVVNNQPGLLEMTGDGSSITIPSVMITMSDGEAIISSLMNGNTVNGTLKEIGPFIKDGDIDNGVIAHEYGHGISNRLTGGPSTASCLQNEEQMGEGWSDFFGLVLTIEPGDQGTDGRGYATYVLNQPVSGAGLRTYPYSTDMAVNPFTYGSVTGQFYLKGSHGVGSVWATMLWDLTWALIDEHGYDPDIYNGTGGNNMAMQLIIDGLKLQGCSPGFVDGRDAILAADVQNYDGANQCLIWSVFANRGLGYSADQGSALSATDQTQAFDMPPESVLDCSDFGATTGFEQSSFQIYPNPTSGMVNIASSKINGQVQIILYDINGRKVLGKNVDMSGQASINVSSLSAGIYVIQLISEGKTQTEKLIVQ